MEQDITQESDGAILEDTSLQEESNAPQQADDEKDTIVVGRGRIPSPLEEALLDFGKDLVKESIAQSVEFNKTMLGLTATFAPLMASTFGILAFGSRDRQLGGFEKAFLVFPVLFMLISSICFALGYYPRKAKIQIRILKTIEDARDSLLRTRRVWAFCGVLFFTVAILSLLFGIIFLNVM